MPDMWLDVDAAVTVPVNLLQLIDDSDFKAIEIDIVYNQAGMDLVWHFITSAGVITATAVTPTTGGDYDWAEDLADKGTYKIELPASGGASVDNDTEGHGWFTGFCTGVLPWRGPVIGFRAAALNDALIDGGDSLDVEMVTAVLNKVADHVNRRGLANIEGSSDGDALAFRSLYGAVCKLVNLLDEDSGNLRIHRSNDTTILGQQALTTDAGAVPVVAVDTV